MARAADRTRTRYGLTIAAQIELPGADDAEARRRADLVRRAVANALAAFGVADRAPIVNVWDGGPINDSSSEQSANTPTSAEMNQEER